MVFLPFLMLNVKCAAFDKLAIYTTSAVVYNEIAKNIMRGNFMKKLSLLLCLVLLIAMFVLLGFLPNILNLINDVAGSLDNTGNNIL